jgi:MIP family channel proteins
VVKFQVFTSGLAYLIKELMDFLIKGAHMNPAVSLTQLLLGKMSIIKFIIYFIGQSIGAFLGSVVVYVVYIDELNAFDGGTRCTTCANATAGIWATYPSAELTIRGGFFDQFFGTALLVLVVLAVTDSKNAEIPHGLAALLIGSTIFLIGMSFGMNCGYAINPIRDFIPRFFTSISGWGAEVYTAYNYFFWIPIVGPFAGAIFSTLLYAIFIENHWPDSE